MSAAALNLMFAPGFAKGYVDDYEGTPHLSFPVDRVAIAYIYEKERTRYLAIGFTDRTEFKDIVAPDSVLRTIAERMSAMGIRRVLTPKVLIRGDLVTGLTERTNSIWMHYAFDGEVRDCYFGEFSSQNWTDIHRQLGWSEAAVTSIYAGCSLEKEYDPEVRDLQNRLIRALATQYVTLTIPSHSNDDLKYEVTDAAVYMRSPGRTVQVFGHLGSIYTGWQEDFIASSRRYIVGGERYPGQSWSIANQKLIDSWLKRPSADPGMHVPV